MSLSIKLVSVSGSMHKRDAGLWPHSVRRYRATAAILGVALGAGMSLGPTATNAQEFPSKPVRIMATTPGGNVDRQARMIAQGITGALGQPVVVDNRPSALLPELVAKSPADGYTIGFAGGVVWLTSLTEKTPYDPIKDFSPVTWVASYPYLLVVHPSLPVKTPKELIALIKARPGELNIAATASPGGQSFLAAELFKSLGKVNLVRVPYKGLPEGLTAVVSGDVHMMIGDIGTVVVPVKAGKLKALAVTSLEPTALAPGLPTLAASGLPGYEVIQISGLVAPAGTPATIVNRLNQEIVRFLNRPDVKETFLKDSVEVVASSPVQFAEKIKSEMSKWAKVLADAGIKPTM